jgi:hypothetical protein
VFWVISVYFNIRNTLPKSGTFLLGRPVYIHNSNSPYFAGLGVAPLTPFGRIVGFSSYSMDPTIRLCAGSVVYAFAIVPTVFVFPP